MGETVKLIVELPKTTYEDLKSGKIYSSLCEAPQGLVEGIRNGTLLDDVKLKIEQDMSLDMFNDYGNETAIHKELWEILDNIGKPESEE